MVKKLSREELFHKNRELEQEASRQKETESALMESEKRLELVLKATSEGIWDWDIVSGRTYASNRCGELFGVKTHSGVTSVTESWASRIHPDDYDAVSNCLRSHLEGKAPFDVEYRHRHEDGAYRWQSARGMALFDEDGRPYRMVGTIQDITDKKRAEEEKSKLETKLQQARKIEALGTLANGLAHDYNNLLTAIMGNIELSRLNLKNEEKIVRNLEKAKDACIRAKDLTRQVITFAKGLDPVKRTSSLAKLVQNITALALAKKNIACELSLPEDLWPVDYDPEQMKLVITNLITNAGEAMNGEGQIQILAENIDSPPKNGSSGKQVKISIQDHGKGIDPETLARIFDPYFSSKGAATRKGVGLGLSICYSIIEKHGGHIEVESEVEKGTTFHIYLPAATESGEQKS